MINIFLSSEVVIVNTYMLDEKSKLSYNKKYKAYI